MVGDVHERARLRIALLCLSITAAIVFIFQPAGDAAAQSVANKQLCRGDGAQQSCSSTSNPQVGDVVHYRFELANGPSNNTFTLTEAYPTDFTPADPANPVKCRLLNGTGLPVTTVSAGPPLQFTVDLPGGADAICVLDGTFTNPGGAAQNTVTLAGQSFQPTVSSSISPNTEFDLDLEVTKSVVYPSATPLNIAGGAGRVRYRIEVTTDEPVYLAEYVRIYDQLALFPNGVGVDASFVAGSDQCVLEQGGGSLVPIAGCGATNALNGAVASAGWQDFVSFTFAPGAIVLLQPGDVLAIEYEVDFSVPVDASCVRQADSEGIRNRAFLGLAGTSQALRDDDDGNNDTVGSPASDMPLVTGIEYVDPDCQLPPPPGPPPPPSPLVVEKELVAINGQPAGPNSVVQWGDTAKFRVRMRNPQYDAVVADRLRIVDTLENRPGTPNFTAQAVEARWDRCPGPPVSATCIQTDPNPFTDPLPGLRVPFESYYDRHRMWSGAVDGPKGELIEATIAIKFETTSCDYSPLIGPKTVRNWVAVAHQTTRMDPDSGQTIVTNHVTRTHVDVKVATPAACTVTVEKEALLGRNSNEVADPAHVDFGKWKRYRLTFSRQAGVAGQPRIYRIGTLVDAVRIVQPNYASGLQVDYSWSCQDPSGAKVRGYQPSGNGSAVTNHVGGPHQGVRIMEHPGFVEFDSGGQLVCDVNVLVHRPDPSDPYCFSDGTPQLENFALMDGSLYFNANNSWPTSAQGNTWDAHQAELPRCINIIVNKRATPSVVAPTGGPITYTIDITNANRPGTDGDIDLPAGTFPTGFGNFPGNFTGVILEDDFVTGPQGAAFPLGALTVPANNPCQPMGAPPCDTLLGGVSGERWIGITTLPAGDTISYTYEVSGPFAPDQLCNHVESTFVIAGRERVNRFYPKNVATWKARTCTPVRSTLEVHKTFVTQPWVTLPPSTTFTIKVDCDVPSGFNDVNVDLAVTPANPSASIRRLPVGSECEIDEVNLPRAKDFGECTWLDEQYPLGDSILIDGTVEPHRLDITNTLDCEPPQQGDYNLRLVKELVSDADCIDNRFCTFRITLTNDGPGYFSGPVIISDSFDNGTVPVFYDMGSFDPHQWGWQCMQGAATTPITCTESALTLGAGQSSFFDISMDLGPAGTNCAVLDIPALQPLLQSCVSVGDTSPFVDTNALSVQKQVKAGACVGAATGSGQCTFLITLTNSGSSQQLGFLEFRDVIIGGAANAGSVSFVSISPTGWICQSNGTVTTCSTNNANLVAGQSITLELTLDLAFAAPVGENCIALTQADAASGDWAACAQIASTGEPRLELTKTKLTAHTCSLGTQTCTFRFTIENVGSGPYSGPITFEDRFQNSTVGTQTLAFQSATAGFDCRNQVTTGGNLYGMVFVCENLSTLSIAAGGQIAVDVTFDYGGTFQARTNCGYLLLSGGAKGPESCVSMTDPALDLSITKEVMSDASQCNYTGSNECRFRITVTNNAAQPYNGPMHVVDMFRDQGNIPQNVSITMPGTNGWTCQTVGAGAYSNCTNPLVNLQPGASTSFEVVFDLTGTPHANMRNCVKIEGPHLVQRQWVCVPLGQQLGERRVDPDEVKEEKGGGFRIPGVRIKVDVGGILGGLIGGGKKDEREEDRATQQQGGETRGDRRGDRRTKED